MQFTTTQQDLHRGLSIVGHAVPGKPTHPIGAYILAYTSVDQQRVRLSARSEDIGIQCWIPASDMRECERALFPATLISDVVGNLPPSPVTITSPSPTDPMSCHVQCVRIRANMKNAAEDPAEFPAIPSFVDGGTTILHVDAELLKQIITEVAFAAANKDALMPALTGVSVEIENGRATFAAADSFRLAVRTILIPDDQLRQTLLLPAKTLETLATILPYEGTVQVLLTEDHHQAVFHTTQMEVSTRLLGSTFPNIKNGALPTEWTTRAILRTHELASLVRLMAPFARQGRNFIRLKLFGAASERLENEPHTVQLEVVAQDVGDNQNIINAQVTGPDQEIDVHVKYLSDVLAIIKTPQIALEVTNKQRPAVIKPVGGSEYTYVMMPVNFDRAQASSQPAVQAVSAR